MLIQHFCCINTLLLLFLKQVVNLVFKSMLFMYFGNQFNIINCICQVMKRIDSVKEYLNTLYVSKILLVLEYVGL